MKPARVAVSAAACFAVMAVLAHRLAGADARAVWTLLSRLGASVCFIPIPYAIAVAVDAWATSRMLALLSAERAVAPLAVVRLRTDAFAATLPAGTVVADSLAPGWIAALSSAKTTDGVAVVTTRKCLVGLAQAAYVAISFAVSPSWIVLGLAIALFFGFTVASMGVFGGNPAESIRGLLGGVRAPLVERWSARHASGFAKTDAAFRTLARARWKLAPPFAAYLGAWLVESFETFLFLRLVGIDVTFTRALAFEPSIALLRSVAFFAPAGLGVQDLGYASLVAPRLTAALRSAGTLFRVPSR